MREPFHDDNCRPCAGFLFRGDLSYVLGRLRERLKKLFLPSRTLPSARHVAVEISSAHSQVYFSPSDRKGTPNLIGSSSAEKRQVKTTYSGFLMRSPLLGGAKDVNEFRENVCARPQRLLQTEGNFRGEKGSLSKR
jgi:hypothetical protein